MSKKGKIIALMMAAGQGTRYGGNVPKQYQTVGGDVMLNQTCAVFLQHPAIDAVVPVIAPDAAALYAELCQLDGPVDRRIGGLEPPIYGGATRQASVRLALQSLQNSDAPPDYVLIHDAARPYVSPHIITRVVSALQSGAQAVLPAIALHDTIKQRQPDGSLHTVDRNQLLAAQTPQGFAFHTIHALHQTEQTVTDDVTLCEQAGLDITIVEGEMQNIKITQSQDNPALAPMRVGQGYDVHAFVSTAKKGHTIRLCGVDVPHPFALEGHSDADVGLHAATDAVLGAAALGDIGQHFSPTDPQWKNADSAQFCRHAAQLCHQAGWHIGNIDLTCIGESPKIASHMQAMQAATAAAFGLEPGQVSIKATTTEGLGFAGRKEGLAAQAVALLVRA